MFKCKLRNNSYRQPENDFYCGEKIKRTFIEIPHYNKLSRCYISCNTCFGPGKNNCSSCRGQISGNYYLSANNSYKEEYVNIEIVLLIIMIMI